MKVGLDASLIGPELFTMLLIMALLMTAMTGLLISLCARRAAVARERDKRVAVQ